MKQQKAKTFSGQRLKLDDTEFLDCKFKDMVLVYSGGPPPSFVGCNFDKCEFAFDGPASDTVAYLRGLASDPGMSKLIKDIFPEIFRR